MSLMAQFHEFLRVFHINWKTVLLATVIVWVASLAIGFLLKGRDEKEGKRTTLMGTYWSGSAALAGIMLVLLLFISLICTVISAIHGYWISAGMFFLVTIGGGWFSYREIIKKRSKERIS